MLLEFCKAILVGIIAAMPVGPILLMVVQRSLSEGRRSGLMVGIGSAVADAIYAGIGLFALALVEGFIAENSQWFLLAGAVLLGFIGIKMMRSKVELTHNSNALPPLKYALQSFLSVLSNPAAIAVMMGLIAAFSLNAEGGKLPFAVIALLVGAGECIYWVLVTFILTRFIHPTARTLQIVSKIMGGAVCVFALVLLVRGIMIIV